MIAGLLDWLQRTDQDRRDVQTIDRRRRALDALRRVREES